MTRSRSSQPANSWTVGGILRTLEAVRQRKEATGRSVPPLPPQLADPLQVADLFGLDIWLTDHLNLEPQTGAVRPPLSPTPVSQPSTPAQASPYLTVGEAAAYLRTTVQTVYDRVKRGTLHPVPGSRGKLLFTKDALDRFLLTRRRR